ncbi:RNA recognition motif protein [Gregarina niphandrodes]|uniref:RNA recognition motif protein n=1 Tax=Gregarina niphandrodes TaxID=110365 RepID=A0A023B365_GRENI|nr:RNA recognition motif protein [Gregarina niphandrodes]EZG55374.1 RNA recognition motif protein [Gregarina niphandrodes]|eukprot:XP_011131598.1 RNA recognition motif protein [Gregarina niphandrodes]
MFPGVILPAASGKMNPQTSITIIGTENRSATKCDGSPPAGNYGRHEDQVMASQDQMSDLVMASQTSHGQRSYDHGDRTSPVRTSIIHDGEIREQKSIPDDVMPGMETDAVPGVFEPEWLRERRKKRMLDEQVEESMAQVQKGRHHYQQQGAAPTQDSATMVPAGQDLPPPELFGLPVELSTVYISNLDESVTSPQSLLQDLTQKSGLPRIKDIRIPTITKPAGGKTAESNKTTANGAMVDLQAAGQPGSQTVSGKGFAYIEFNNAQDARTAVKMLAEVKINGRKLQVQLSQPTKPVYEPTVLYIPNLDPEITEEAIQALIENEYAQYKKDNAGRKRLSRPNPDPRKRSRNEAEQSVDQDQPAVHISDPLAAEASAAAPPATEPPDPDVFVDQRQSDGSPVDRLDEGPDKYCEKGPQSWKVVGVRIIEPRPELAEASLPDEEAAPRHAYVEFRDRASVLEILRWQQERCFCVGDRVVVLVPSVPKKRTASSYAKNKRERLTVDQRIKRTLYVSNIPVGMKEPKFRTLCEECGPIQELLMPHKDGVSVGWALVEYRDAINATTASTTLSGRKCGPKFLKVKQSKSAITKQRQGESREERHVGGQADAGKANGAKADEATAAGEKVVGLGPGLRRRRPTEFPESGGESRICGSNDEFRRMLGL